MVAVGFTHFKQRLIAGVIALGCVPALPAIAAETYGLNWQVGAQWQHEDNLFLRPDGFQAQDSVLGSFAQVRYNKAYSLQKFSLNAKVTDYRYSKFDYLDYLGKDLGGTWSWSLTPQLTGALTSSRQESLNSFLDYDGSKRNLRRENKDQFDVRWHMTGGWFLAGGGAHTSLRNTSGGVRFFEGDYTADSAEVGLQYKFASQSEITLVQIQQQGEYRERVVNPQVQLDKGFDQANQEMRLKWALTGKSQLNIKAGYLNRQHDNFSARDFQGGYGLAEYAWNSGGKITLKFNATRDYQSFQSIPAQDLAKNLASNDYYNSSYYLRHVLSVTPTWQLADKIIISGKLQQEERDYEGGLLGQAVLPTRQDKLHLGSFSLTWVPRDLIALSLYGTMHDRRSNLNAVEFDANSYGVSAAISF